MDSQGWAKWSWVEGWAVKWQDDPDSLTANVTLLGGGKDGTGQRWLTGWINLSLE